MMGNEGWNRLLHILNAIRNTAGLALGSSYVMMIAFQWDWNCFVILAAFLIIVATTVAMSLIEWGQNGWRISVKKTFIAMTLIALVLGLWASVGLFDHR